MKPQAGNMWKFNVNSGDGGFSRDGITFSSLDELDLEGSRGIANFIVRWDKASSQSYIKLVDMKGVTGKYRYVYFELRCSELFRY